MTINLYDSVALTGYLPDISGITQTPLTESVVIPATPSSGIHLTGESVFLKKDFLFFKGKRL